MFSLILTIVAIALVTVLALATLYFGGSAFRQGHSQAEASKLLLEGQQLNAALSLYHNATGTKAQSLDQLMPDYLKSDFPQWGVTDDLVFTPQPTQPVCLAFNKKLGIDTVPSCTDSSYAGKTVCCTQ